MSNYKVDKIQRNCRHSKFKFLDTRGLKDHLITPHSERVKTLVPRFSQKRKRWNCCKNILKIFCILGCNLKLHSGEKPRKCNHCQNKIKTCSILEGHVKLHSGLNPKKCRHCNFKFLDTRGLKDHMITLHGERVKTLIPRFLQKRIDATAAKNILKIFCILGCPIELRCGEKPKMLFM